MSTTVLGYQAMKAGYEGASAQAQGLRMSGAEVMAVIHEVGETIGIDSLYAIEAKTTEAEHYRRNG
jgi:hypothetical protein